MGIYINPRNNQTKEAWLKQHGIQMTTALICVNMHLHRALLRIFWEDWGPSKTPSVIYLPASLEQVCVGQ